MIKYQLTIKQQQKKYSNYNKFLKRIKRIKTEIEIVNPIEFCIKEELK